jgi:hypothetical protein
MNNKLLRITNDRGRHFNVRILKQGDSYGRNACLTLEGHEPAVEFFDATHENNPDFFSDWGGLGQFTGCRYCIKTILKGPRQGLNLGVSEWTIDSVAMDIVRAWLNNQTEGEI